MKFIDFFSGAGGMRMGLERAGHTCVGFCEWDKYARQSYKAIFNTEGEWENHDIRTASSMELPKADLWTYGFPCQGISVAGKQKGIGKGAEDEEADERSNLFFQIIRLLQGLSEEDRPEWLLCENVKNLLSIDRGFGFLRVLCCLDEAGYDSEWQVFNTKYSYIVGETVVSGIPQNRERVYVISHLRRKGKREVFPIPRADRENIAELQQIGNMAYSENSVKNNSAAGRVYNKDGLAPTLRTPSGGGMNLALLTENIPSEACCIDAIYNNREPRITDHCPTLRADRQGVCVGEPRAVLTPDREEKRQNGRRMKNGGEPMFTLTAQDRHGVAIQEPINTNTDGTSRCICAGLYKQNWSHFDPTREKQTYTGVMVYEEAAILKKERNEYGKQVRKAYESGELVEKRANMTQYVPRTDGVSNTLTSVEKDNYLILKGGKSNESV